MINSHVIQWFCFCGASEIAIGEELLPDGDFRGAAKTKPLDDMTIDHQY